MEGYGLKERGMKMVGGLRVKREMNKDCWRKDGGLKERGMRMVGGRMVGYRRDE